MTNQGNNNKQLIQEYISKDLKLKGNNLPVLSFVIDKISTLDSSLSIAALIPEVSALIADTTILSVSASTTAVGSIVLFPVGILVNIINGMEAGLRMYGMRAVSYTMTAWVYDDVIPTRSPTILRNINTGRIRAKAWDIQQRNQAWNIASISVIQRLNSEIKAKKIKKETLQLIFKALSENDRQKLNLIILKGFEDQLSPIEKITWRSNYMIRYPF